MNLSENTSFYEWLPTAWLRVSGEDAANFLQGQFTNELRQLKADGQEAVYGLWLNQKGKVLADSFIVRTADAFWVGSYASTAAVIKERLEAYIIADDVTIEDVTAAWMGMTVFKSERPMKGAGVVFQGRRCTTERHFEWVFPREKVAEVRALIGKNSILSDAHMERLRIEAGIPSVPFDIGPNDLPNEGGLETDAISYTKGCYLGQEVMARLKSMGQVRRQLVRVRADMDQENAIPSLPAALYQGDKKIGELRTAVISQDGRGFVGLALVALMHWRKEEGIGFSPGGLIVMKGASL